MERNLAMLYCSFAFQGASPSAMAAFKEFPSTELEMPRDGIT